MQHFCFHVSSRYAFFLCIFLYVPKRLLSSRLLSAGVTDHPGLRARCQVCICVTCGVSLSCRLGGSSIETALALSLGQIILIQDVDTFVGLSIRKVAFNLSLATWSSMTASRLRSSLRAAGACFPGRSARGPLCVQHVGCSEGSDVGPPTEVTLRANIEAKFDREDSKAELMQECQS